MTNGAENLQKGEMLAALKPFRPVAYYDKHLDAIRVQIADCSIFEDRRNKLISIYLPNHADGKLADIVGFSIKGVRYLLNKLQWPHDGAIQLAGFLDALVKEYPTESMLMVADFYRQLGDSAPAEVKYQEAA
jgi:hypothetical protein